MPACSFGAVSGHAAAATAKAAATVNAIPPQRRSSMTRNAVKRANEQAASTTAIQIRFEG